MSRASASAVDSGGVTSAAFTTGGFGASTCGRS